VNLQARVLNFSATGREGRAELKHGLGSNLQQFWSSLQHSQFHIGLEFWCGERRFRCTDIGSRVVVAIRIDAAEIAAVENRRTVTRKSAGADAEARGWFSGPPYPVAECVFDENDLEATSLDGVA
jgi:hypothetical protein